MQVMALPSGARPTIAEVQQAVCEREGLLLDEIKSASRERRIAWPRQVAMALAWEMTGRSYVVVGKAFGGRCSQTVYLSRRKITREAKRNPELASLLADYRRTLMAPRLHVVRAHDRKTWFSMQGQREEAA